MAVVAVAGAVWAAACLLSGAGSGSGGQETSVVFGGGSMPITGTAGATFDLFLLLLLLLEGGSVAVAVVGAVGAAGKGCVSLILSRGHAPCPEPR